MKGANFGKEEGINTYLFSGDPVSEPIQYQMYNDPYYGLNNLNNYARWDGLMNYTSPLG